MFDPTLLSAFSSVATTGSFTRAAEQLHRTQSTISFQVKRLEERFGRPLFRRTTRRVVLTQEGELFLAYARRILKIQDEARRHFQADSQLEGTIRIGVTEDFASSGLATVLAAFKNGAPAVRINVEVGITLDLVAQLERGDLDVVLGKRCGREETGDLLWAEPLHWSFARDHNIDDFDDLPLALFQAPCVFRAAAVEALQAEDIPHKIVFVSRSFAGLRAAAAAGLAVTVLPQSLLGGEIQPLGEEFGLPKLPEVQFVMFRGQNRDFSAAEQQLFGALRSIGGLRR